MAWNEPGNNGEKDPWGSRQDQGPPDLDEAFKKLKDNLGGMFGGGSGAGGCLCWWGWLEIVPGCDCAGGARHWLWLYGRLHTG